MINHKKSGDLLKENVDALVNTVNCVGIMGKGIALQFKMAYPKNYDAYKKACDKEEVMIGKMFVYRLGNLFNPKYIINFPTKNHWKEKSRIEYIEKGLDNLVDIIKELKIKSIAIPPLGTGSGGLNWGKVKKVLEKKLSDLSDVNSILYAPSKSPEPESIKHSRKAPKMTLGRACLIRLLENYTRAGYSTSLLELQKLMYFLQESGEDLRLRFEKAKYGPYANNLHHVLQMIDSHFIGGYGDRTYRSQISILPLGRKKTVEYFNEHPDKLNNLHKVIELIKGFETPYGLELLSSVHWIVKKENILDLREIIRSIEKWNPRKKWLFNPKHIHAAIKKLEEEQFV